MIYRVLVSAGRYNSQQGGQNVEDEGPLFASCRSGTSRGSHADLSSAMQRLEGRSYPAYNDVEGSWSFPSFTFILDRAQSDPFAQPSRCRVLVRLELFCCLCLAVSWPCLPGHDVPNSRACCL